MATHRQRSSGTWEFIFRRKGVLPKPVSVTFDTLEQGLEFESKAEALLASGIVPPEFVQKTIAAEKYKTLGLVIKEYLREVPEVSQSDRVRLSATFNDLSDKLTVSLTADWAESWVKELKMRKLTPTSIRHRVGSLRRCFDWAGRKHVTALVVNPLKLLPKKYSVYSKKDIAEVGEEILDESRDRRLSEDGTEEKRIREALANPKLENKEAMNLLFDLALESAMRMREMFTLEIRQIKFDKETIFLEKTKNGDKRQVPMTTISKAKLQDYINAKHHSHGRLFSCWYNGTDDEDELDDITSEISRAFSKVFKEAGCDDLRFHDLRHEATSRIYERTTLTDVQISSITGHKDIKVLKRYANLRGSQLSKKLW